MRPIDADAIPYSPISLKMVRDTMLYKKNWVKGTGREELGVWKSVIDKMPTIEAEPIRSGHWIIDRKFGNDIMSNEQMVICSECKQGIFWGKQNYCPNCGALMEEQE